jgi:hypothetical protein
VIRWATFSSFSGDKDQDRLSLGAGACQCLVEHVPELLNHYRPEKDRGDSQVGTHSRLEQLWYGYVSWHRECASPRKEADHSLLESYGAPAQIRSSPRIAALMQSLSEKSCVVLLSRKRWIPAFKPRCIWSYARESLAVVEFEWRHSRKRPSSECVNEPYIDIPFSSQFLRHASHLFYRGLIWNISLHMLHHNRRDMKTSLRSNYRRAPGRRETLDTCCFYESQSNTFVFGLHVK